MIIILSKNRLYLNQIRMKSLQELRKKLKKPKQPTQQNAQAIKEQKPKVQNDDNQNNQKQSQPLLTLTNEGKQVISNEQAVSNVQKSNIAQIIDDRQQKYEKPVQIINEAQQAQPEIKDNAQIISMEPQHSAIQQTNQIKENHQQVDMTVNDQELERNGIMQEEKLVQQPQMPQGQSQNNHQEKQVPFEPKENISQRNDNIKQGVIPIKEQKKQTVRQQMKNPIDEKVQQSTNDIPQQGLSKIQMMRQKMRLKKLLSASSKSIPQTLTNQVPRQEKNQNQPVHDQDNTMERRQHQSPKEMEIEVEQSVDKKSIQVQHIEPKNQTQQNFETMQVQKNQYIERNIIEKQDYKQNQKQSTPQPDLKPVQNSKPRIIQKQKPVQNDQPQSTLFHKLHHLRQYMTINPTPSQKPNHELNPQYIKSFIKQLQTFKKNLQQWQTISSNQ